MMIPKPETGEYTPYMIAYLDLVPDDGNVLEHLQSNLKRVIDLMKPLPEEKLSTPHAEGEWTIKEILVHIIDTERIFAYRALRFARNDPSPINGFEYDEYVPASQANSRSLSSILEEYQAVRHATIHLLRNLPPESYTRTGIASENNTSVRALAYMIAGHEMHHFNSIRENYLAD